MFIYAALVNPIIKVSHTLLCMVDFAASASGAAVVVINPLVFWCKLFGLILKM